MRTPFDKLGKQSINEALAPSGRIETEAEVTTETRRIDVWFEPDPQAAPPSSDLGLLARMATGPRAFELYHPITSLPTPKS